MVHPIRPALILLAAAVLAGPADAQLRRRPAGDLVKPPPRDLPPAAAEVWPFPPPDPRAWWEDRRPVPPEAANPLGDRRRLAGGEQAPVIDNGVDAGGYRVWGLAPLQWQVLRGDEMILEAWTRPTGGVRQGVVRITVRRDGRAFVQGRAGLVCCEVGIARRIGFDEELPAGSAAAFLALRSHPMWGQPRDVQVVEGGGASPAVCVDGTAYDLTLLVPGRARSLHRACDRAAIGQAADALEPVFRAALGHDPRFDLLFPTGADFGDARRAYHDLIAGGGALSADPGAKAPAPQLPSTPGG